MFRYVLFFVTFCGSSGFSVCFVLCFARYCVSLEFRVSFEFTVHKVL